MGYAIFTGLRLETLIRDHADEFRTGFFDRGPMIAVQSQSLAQWLKLRLADWFGGWVTGDLVFQDEALRRLLADSGTDASRVLFLDELKFALYRRLEAGLGPGGDPVLAPLAGGATPDPARLFELADHIAGVFHGYAMNSDLWPGALTEGRLPPDLGADPAAFAWQARLWRDLVDGPEGTLAGLVLARSAASPPAPWGRKPRLVLVGSAFLSRRALAFLRSWADAGLIDVVHLLLLPAAPDRLAGSAGDRPWSSWGTFGRAFLARLPEAGAAGPTAAAPVSDQGPALKRLQAALTGGRPFTGPADASLEVLCCPHPLRELELLRDRLLAELGARPELPLHEIAVLAPDINVYAPFFDTVFGSDDPGRRLKYHVIDLDLGRENAWLQALDALLALLSGVVDRPKLFALVDSPAFRAAWNLEAEDRDLWLEFTDEVSAWREEPGPQSWTAGTDRLFTGWFRADPAPGSGVPPVPAAPGAFRSLGRLDRLIRELADVRADLGRPRAFTEWVGVFDGLAARYLGDGEGTAATLSGRLRTLAQGDGGPPWPWGGFRAFVQDQIAHFPGRRGQLLTEGLHCSSLRPLRAIPFRVIAVLGLDEGAFPRRSPTPSFDLRRHEKGQDEVSPLALDRYTFWETLMAAGDRLILSYQGRSAVDGSERPASPVLADLLDFLETAEGAWPVTVGSVKDFSAAPEDGPTWSLRTWRRRRALAAGAGAAAQASDEAPASEVADPAELFPEVRAGEAAEAFVRPARFHLKRVRQVVLRDEDRRGTDGEEPWSMEFYDRHRWLTEGLRRFLAGVEPAWDADAAVGEAEAVGRVRRGVFADRDRAELVRRSADLRRWAAGWLAGGWIPEQAGAPAARTHWAGRPWAPEAEDRLVQPGRRLLLKVGYSEKLPVRAQVEAALRVLQEPARHVELSVLGPSGGEQNLRWGPDAEETRRLGAEAEAYWLEAVRRPLALYPDLLADFEPPEDDDPAAWEDRAEAAWNRRRDGQFGPSEATLVNDPYAALAFGTEGPPAGLADDLKRWWAPLWGPLLEAWE